MTTTKTKRATDSERAAEPADPRIAGLEKQLADLQSQFNETLSLVGFMSKQLNQEKKDDFFHRQDRAQEIRKRSLQSNFGEHTWRVKIPGIPRPCYFQCEHEHESAAIREFEVRFGTRFISNSTNEDGNHAIEKVDVSESPFA